MNEDSAIDYSSSDKHGQVHSAERPVMVPVGTKRRRVPESQRSLCFILLALKNEEVSIELKNESVVTGTIAECDSAMNVTLVNAHIKSEEVNTYHLNIPLTSSL
jgi:small nuclear ribonucleoprotein (snRNP)-like protein